MDSWERDNSIDLTVSGPTLRLRQLLWGRGEKSVQAQKPIRQGFAVSVRHALYESVQESCRDCRQSPDGLKEVLGGLLSHPRERCQKLLGETV